MLISNLLIHLIKFFVQYLSLLILVWLSYATGFSQNKADSLPVSKIDRYNKIFKDSLVGKPYIDFSGKFLQGVNFKLSDHLGEVVFLNFWFIGCPPCMGEIPDINKLYRMYKDSNVVIISLAADKVEKLLKFNEGKYSRPPEKIEYPIIADCQKIAEKYKVTGFPTSIFIDKKGIIRIVSSGASIQSLKNYIAFYGDKNLSKGWKKMARENKDKQGTETSEIFSGWINELLRE